MELLHHIRVIAQGEADGEVYGNPMNEIIIIFMLTNVVIY
jgi:hypothetical protein